MSRQYDDEQYFEDPDYELNTGFTNYDRLLIELNNRMVCMAFIAWYIQNRRMLVVYFG